MDCVITREICLEKCEESLQYVLFKSKRKNYENTEAECVFSILCIYCLDGVGESEFVYDITSDLETAIEIFNAICNGSVFPENIREVLCDIL